MRNFFILLCLLVSPFVHAEIYKWMDAEGHAHFSDNKYNAGTTKVEELEIKIQPAATQMVKAPNPSWQSPRIVLPRQNQIRSTFSASLPSNSDAYPRKDQPETNASRCLLARNVISGAVRHSNNAPTDSYDREVANRDIRNNCH